MHPGGRLSTLSLQSLHYPDNALGNPWGPVSPKASRSALNFLGIVYAVPLFWKQSATENLNLLPETDDEFQLSCT